MKTKLLTAILFLILTSFLLNTNIFAEDTQKSSVEEQLSQILNSQMMIQQRLSTIEAKQSSIMATLQGLQRASQPPMPPTEDMNKEYKIDVGNSSVLGDKNAKVTIVEFSDFQCPFSQRFHPFAVEAVKSYPKGVNYILKDFPLQFHPNARPAAKAALAAREQGKYWEMVEALFANGTNLGDDKYKELAQKLGLNVDKFSKDLKEKDAQWEKLIAEDLTVADSSDVRGTPTFYINGKKTQARDVNSFKAEIDKVLNGNQK